MVPFLSWVNVDPHHTSLKLAGSSAQDYTAFWRVLTMKYKIAIQQTEEGYSISVPGLPGCWSQGATETEAIANIREAIKDYLVVRDDLIRGADVREVEVG
jgi:predicted RNase H-like HicB family nuclease